jgi:hypothetical protein
MRYTSLFAENLYHMRQSNVFRKYMSYLNSYKVTVLTVLTILSFSTLATTLAYAAPLADNGKDWQNVNGNSWAQNYSPQTQINKGNVDNLEVKWIFPLGGKTSAPNGIQSVTLGEGSSTPPIVRNGIVYVMTNYKRLYAGKVEMQYLTSAQPATSTQLTLKQARISSKFKIYVKTYQATCTSMEQTTTYPA